MLLIVEEEIYWGFERVGFVFVFKNKIIFYSIEVFYILFIDKIVGFRWLYVYQMIRL